MWNDLLTVGGWKGNKSVLEPQFVFWNTPNENMSSVITQSWMKASLLMDLQYVIKWAHVEKNAAITNTSSGFDFGYKTFLCVRLKILQDQKLNRLCNRILVTLFGLLCSCAGTSGLTHTMQQWLFDVICHIWATNFLTLQGCLYFMRMRGVHT